MRDRHGAHRIGAKGIRRLAAMLILAAGTQLAIAGAAQANDIAKAETVFATDVTAAGFGGMRGNGVGTITLGGVTGPVTKALLYWHGPTNSTDPNANASVLFNGAPVTGANIGFSSDNCWGFQNSQAYRADVTSLVSGNGTYPLANFIKPDAEINGVSLIVFFNDGNAGNNRDVVIFQGNDSNIDNPNDAPGWNVNLSGINYTSGSASLDLSGISDGQSFADDALMLNSQVLVPAGPIFEGDSVPNGASAGATAGGLWDIKSYDITSFLSPGSNTLQFTTGVNNDCLSAVLIAVNLPAGAAPPDGIEGRMVSNGRRDNTTFASIQECNAAQANAKNRPFTVQWSANGTKTFKIDDATSIVCTNDAAFPPRPAGFNRQEGEGTGSINGVPGYRIEWDLVDGGTSASQDRVEISIERISDGNVERHVTFGAPTGQGVFAMPPTSPPAA